MPLGADAAWATGSSRGCGWGWSPCKGVCGGGGYQVVTSKEQSHRALQMNLPQGGDPKFVSSSEWEVMVYKQFAVTSALIQEYISLME